MILRVFHSMCDPALFPTVALHTESLNSHGTSVWCENRAPADDYRIYMECQLTIIKSRLKRTVERANYPLDQNSRVRHLY